MAAVAPENGNRILCLGLLCLDYIYVMPQYPSEDEDVRALSQARSRGGNASTNTVILSQLGWEHVEFLGSVGDTLETEFCLGEVTKYGIVIENCVKHEGLSQPNTCAIINKSNGSRTLIHYHGGFPELNFNEFSNIKLNLYKHIHLEGRTNVAEMIKIFLHITEWNKTASQRVFMSFEMEKPNDYGIIPNLADVIFVSSEYAQSRGYKDMQSATLGISEKIREGSIVICTWGAKGACGGLKKAVSLKQEDLVFSEAFHPETGVKDTLGAGDCFIAACIFALNSIDTGFVDKELVRRVISFGCKVAGCKCGIYGFELDRNTISQCKSQFLS